MIPLSMIVLVEAVGDYPPVFCLPSIFVDEINLCWLISRSSLQFAGMVN